MANHYAMALPHELVKRTTDTPIIHIQGEHNFVHRYVRIQIVFPKCDTPKWRINDKQLFESYSSPIENILQITIPRIENRYFGELYFQRNDCLELTAYISITERFPKNPR